MPEVTYYRPRKSYDVLITRRGEVSKFGRAFSYLTWPDLDHHERIPYLVFEDPELYPYNGEQIEVSGTTYTFIPGEGNYFIIDRTITKDFVIKPGNKVSLIRPIRGRVKNTTFAGKVRASINGNEIELEIPVILYEKVIDDRRAQPTGVVTRVDIPTEEKKYYLLHAKFS